LRDIKKVAKKQDGCQAKMDAKNKMDAKKRWPLARGFPKLYGFDRNLAQILGNL
jgi:hypothetical protein